MDITNFGLERGVQGTEDHIVPFEESIKIKKLIPQAELFPIEGADHHLVLEKCFLQSIVNKIVEFLS